MNPVFIAGPTAVGKSEIAVALAEKIGGEIISVDSMQVYRGLDVGTAKPEAETRAKIPHHLIDICDLTESFDAAKFVRLAGQAADAIQSRKKTPVFCGGTGLYFKAFAEGLGAAPPADPPLRARLESMPLEKLLDELRQGDPVAFEKMDKRNPRRVIRALEVLRLTSKPISSHRADWQANTKAQDGLYLLTRSPDDLRRRIDRRVDEMFRRGLVSETRELLKHGLAENRTAMQAIGYRQVVEHLRGEHNLADTVELVKIRTRQFAKRQLTWFRRQARGEWIELRPEEPLDQIVKRLRS